MDSSFDAVLTPTISPTSASLTVSSSVLGRASSNDSESTSVLNPVASSEATTSAATDTVSDSESTAASETTSKTATTTSATSVASSTSVRSAPSSMSTKPSASAPSQSAGVGDSVGGGSSPSGGGPTSNPAPPPPESSTKPPPPSTSSSASKPPTSSTPKPPSSTPKPTSTLNTSSTTPAKPITTQQPSPPGQTTHSSAQTSGTSQPSNPTSSNQSNAAGSKSGSTGSSSSVGPTSSLSSKSSPLADSSVAQGVTQANGAVFSQSSTPTPEGSSRPSGLPLSNDNNNSGFFANRGKVAGTFVAVGIVALLILALVPCLLARYRRRNRSRSVSRRPPMGTYSDLQYRRTSQMQAFGDTLSAGASLHRGPSARSMNSTDSNIMSSDTNHSSEPIMRRGLAPLRNFAVPSNGSNEGYSNSYGKLGSYPEMIMKTTLTPVPEVPSLRSNNSSSLYAQNTLTSSVRSMGPLINYSLPRPTTGQSENSEQAHLQPPKLLPDRLKDLSRESSPSLYPSSIASNDGDKETEEAYWKRQGFERVSDSEPASVTSTQPSKRLPTPPDSALGLLRPAASQSSMKQSVASDNESDIVKGLHPQMQATSLHAEGTAPIRMPLSVSEGRWINQHLSGQRPS